MHLDLLDVDFAVKVSAKHFRLFLFDSVLASVKMWRWSSHLQRLVANVADTVGGSLPTLEARLVIFWSWIDTVWIRNAAFTCRRKWKVLRKPEWISVWQFNILCTQHKSYTHTHTYQSTTKETLHRQQDLFFGSWTSLQHLELSGDRICDYKYVANSCGLICCKNYWN